jgi:hypothetical protein
MALKIPTHAEMASANAGSVPDQSAGTGRESGLVTSVRSHNLKPTFSLSGTGKAKYVPRLVMDLSGEQKTGKNHFGFTAPGPIYEHSFDIGNEGVIEKFMNQKKIYVAEYELEIQPGDASDREVAEAADKVWQQFTTNFLDGLSSCGSGTTLVDTGSEMWELLRIARFGRTSKIMPHNYGDLNKEMRLLVRETLNHSGSTIFLSQMKPEWENYVGSDGKEKGRKTGRLERVGWKGMPFLVQLTASTNRVDKTDGGSEFTITVDDCRRNPDMNGLTLANDFDTLMMMVYGE